MPSLRRKPPAPPVVVAPEPAAPSSRASGKGRATPKRSDVVKKRGGPVAPPPQTRKEAAQRLRAEQRAGRGGGKRERQILPRDEGPVRALARDVVDSRRNVAVLMLPVSIAVILAQLTGNIAVLNVVFRVLVATLLALVFDWCVLIVGLRRRIGEDFPQEDKLRGHVGYALLRSTVLRRFRMPLPRTAPPTLFSKR